MAKNTKGFVHFYLILLLLVLAIVSVVGYRVYSSHNTAEPSSSPVPTTSKDNSQAIKNSSDLTQAAQTANNQAVDSDLNPDSYNEDLNDLY